MAITANKFQPDEAFALEMDAADPLARFRDRFYIPKDTIYLDGNSLGLMPKDAEPFISRVLGEWKEKAINGWLEGVSPWFYLSEKLGTICAEMVGAEPGEVVCTGTTTINIHSLISTFYHPKGKRTKILSKSEEYWNKTISYEDCQGEQHPPITKRECRIFCVNSTSYNH